MKIKAAIAGILALFAGLSPVIAQQFPTVPDRTVIGRIGVGGQSGPSQAIPFANFLPNLVGAQSANTVFSGPASGGSNVPSFRLLVGADLPNPGASSKGGVQSLTCSASNWFNTLSTGGVLGCAQPNFNNLAGTIAGAQIPSSTITSAMIVDATIVDADVNASAAIVLSKLATQANNTFVGNISGGVAVPVALTPGQVGGALCVPVRNVFTTGTAQTYTTPTCNSVTATWLEVEVQGGGGGGGGSGTAGQGLPNVGNASSFGALSAAGGVVSGSNVIGGAGGACSGSLGTQQNFPGSAGTSVASTTANSLPGGNGGVSFYGGYGVGGSTGAAGGAAPTNSGGGGGGGANTATASSIAGAGGGPGCHISTIIAPPAVSYTYTVGASVSGGVAGTSGFAGGGGAAGLITVVAHWQ